MFIQCERSLNTRPSHFRFFLTLYRTKHRNAKLNEPFFLTDIDADKWPVILQFSF